MLCVISVRTALFLESIDKKNGHVDISSNCCKSIKSVTKLLLAVN